MNLDRRDVIGLGVIAVDEMLHVDSYPPADGKKFVLGRRRQGGGNASCALAAAARLGSRCVMLGRLGDDDLSLFARERLAEAGIDLSLLLHDSESGPLHSVIIVSQDTGTRAILADRERFKPLEPDELFPDWFCGARVLMVDHIHPPVILPAVRLAREAGLQVVSDIERDMPQLAEVRRYVDHYICSAEFAVPFTQSEDPATACRRLVQGGPPQTVVVTAGAAGCYWCAAGTDDVQHVPGHAIKPVDTTGCGDVFHGAFCHAMVAEWSVERAICFANAAAAIKATRTGGWAAVPALSEIQELLRIGDKKME